MSFLQIPIQTYPNTSLGYQALIQSNLDPNILGGSPNTAFGYFSLKVNYTGTWNSAFGNLSMQKNTTGGSNSAFGNFTLSENIGGNFNSAFGDNALATNTIGSDNSGFGYQALGRLISGNKNTAFGVRALWGPTLAESENSAFGYESLSNISGGTRNSAFGYQSGSAITLGSKNSILGSYSGNQGGLDIRTLSNYIVLSDGDGNPRLWITDTGAVNIPGGISLTGSLAITGGTVTANNPVLSATQTWNNAAVTFTGWQLNVTDTASNAGSLLMDLQVGGSSRFSVNKSGNITAVSGSATAVSLAVGGAGTGVYSRSAGFLNLSASGTARVDISNVETLFGTNVGIGTSLSATSGSFVYLNCDAANTLAQRNGVNAQTLRVYNTFTDASNYERLSVGWSGNVLTIQNQNAGTGLARDINIIGITYLQPAGNKELLIYNAYNSTIPTVAIYGGSGVGDYLRFNTQTLDFYPASSGTWSIGRTALPFKNLFLRDYAEMNEMAAAPAAPAANQVRIYAEDNGSGKTRLMARFATGAAQQIAIEP